MASLIPGFEYDIFISYRQKDNKGDRWVSEFVEALKTELESTFKEEISVYFDINPHDGLLETHDVDASLKEKLKCLVFIPVISRTYCDPKSFAWEHEFKAFIEQASGDQFGLKIKLPSGNVATRVLPVRIHELDNEDIKLCESLTGGFLRGVEFIYKEPGVNRPLRANEDRPNDNLNKTFYRNQINNVANALNEIIKSLTQADHKSDGNIAAIKEERKTESRKFRLKAGGLFAWKFKSKRLLIPMLLILFIPVAYIFYRTYYLNTIERTIAVIPLRIANNDTSLKNDGDYFIEALSDKLNLIKSISLKPTISTLQFRNTDKPLDVIRKELRTNYLIDGNIRKEGAETKIWIELSAAKKKKMLWSKTYIWEKNLAHQITKEIVREVASNLDIALSQEEEKQIVTEPSKYLTANMNYISANAILKDAWFYINYGDKILDSAGFSSAIATYDKVIKEDSLFAIAYAKRAIAISWGYYDHQLDSSYFEKCRKDIYKALSLDKNLPETQIALGFYHYYCDIDYDKAIFYFTRAAEMDPGNYQPLYYLSLVYRRIGKWKESQDLMNRVIRFNPQEAIFLTNIGLSFEYLHKYDSAIIFHQKAIDLVPGWFAAYKNKIQTMILKDGRTREVMDLLEDAIKKTGNNMIEEKIRLSIFGGDYSEALNKAEQSSSEDFALNGTRFIYLAEISSLLNKSDDARKYYDSALVILTHELNKNSATCAIHGLAGLAWAGVGNKKKAVEEGQKAIILTGIDNMDGSDMKLNLAQIYTMTGEYDSAISLISFLLNNPSSLSKKLLQIDPVWKPLHDNPEYKKVIKKYSGN